MRASCFRLILENYAVLMEEWGCLLVRTITTRCACKDNRMLNLNGTISLFLWFAFGGQLHSHTDNLSKDLQGAKVAAVNGQGLAVANLTKETITKMPVIRALTISMLIFPARAKACLVNERFQESDALRPD